MADPLEYVLGHDFSVGWKIVAAQKLGMSGPVTSFLFLRYRLQSFKAGAEVLDQ